MVYFVIFVKEFYLSFAVKLFQNRFYIVVCFCFSWYKYSRRNTVRHIYTQLSPGVDFLCVCMYLFFGGGVNHFVLLVILSIQPSKKAYNISVIILFLVYVIQIILICIWIRLLCCSTTSPNTNVLRKKLVTVKDNERQRKIYDQKTTLWVEEAN